MQWLHLLFAGTTKFEIHGAKPVGGTQRVGGVAVFPEKKGNLRTGLSLVLSRVCGGVGGGGYHSIPEKIMCKCHNFISYVHNEPKPLSAVKANSTSDKIILQQQKKGFL